MARELSGRDSWAKAIRGSKPAVIDFHAEWCGPCKVISPVFHQLAEKYGSELDFYSVDVDAEKDIAESCNITAMPTFAVFSGGDQVAVLRGALKDHLTGMIEATLEGLREANNASRNA